MIHAPRSLIGPVFAMARPRRPRAEIIAVHEAAALVRGETGLRAAQPVAREIAKRVMVAFFADLERDDDALFHALAEMEQKLFPSPFLTLATCPEIDTARDYVDRWLKCLRARGGRFISIAEQAHLRDQLADEVHAILFARYREQLRSSQVC